MIDNIDLSKSKEYTLSIRLSSDGFSFSVINPQKKSDFMFSQFEISATTSVSANLKRWLTETKELNLEYKKVYVIFDSPRFMAVPLPLYQEENKEKIFYYNYSNTSNEKVLSNTITDDNVVILFGVDKYCNQIVHEHFSNASVFCSVTPLLKYYFSKGHLGINKKIFVQLSEHDITLFCFDNEKLLLMNSYSCKQIPDRAYYILYAWNNIGGDIENDEIILNGNIKDKDSLQKELKRFVPGVYSLSVKSEFNRSPIAQIESLSFDMLTLLICE